MMTHSVRKIGQASLLLGLLSAPAYGLTTTSSVEATKVAPVQNLFPNAYGKVLLRHYLERKDGDETPKVLARYTLGSTFFDKKLDSYFDFSVERKAQSTAFEPQDIAFNNYFTLFKNDYVSLKPLAEITFPRNTGGAKGVLGATVPVKFEQSLAQGKLTLSSYVRADSSFGTKENEETTELRSDRSGRTMSTAEASQFALVSSKGLKNEPYKVTQKASTLNGEFSVGASFVPAALKELTLSANTYHYKTFSPQMELDSKTQTVGVKKTGDLDQPVYKTTFSKEQEIEVTYNLQEGLSVANSFCRRDPLRGQAQFLNTITVTAAIF